MRGFLDENSGWTFYGNRRFKVTAVAGRHAVSLGEWCATFRDAFATSSRVKVSMKLRLPPHREADQSPACISVKTVGNYIRTSAHVFYAYWSLEHRHIRAFCALLLLGSFTFCTYINGISLSCNYTALCT
jgi:hypothetical protein